MLGVIPYSLMVKTYNMTILVTGGSSMAGKHLQKILPKAIYLSSKECNLIIRKLNLFNSS